LENKIELTKGEQRVFHYMLEFGSITSMQAILDLGETRLAGRIFTLKKKNVKIGSEYLSVSNRYGERRRVKKYWIV